MVRAGGIEPPSPAWKAGVLPLNYAREGPRLRLEKGQNKAGGILEVKSQLFRVEMKEARVR